MTPTRDILDFVIYPCTETICDVISIFEQNFNICGMREDIKKKKEKKTPFLFSLKDLSNKHNLILTTWAL